MVVLRSIAVLAGVAAVLTVAPVAAQAPADARGLEGVRVAVEARIRESGATSVGVYARALGGADSLVIDGDARFHAASMMKVPVMIQVFRDADDGQLRLGARIPVVNQFASLVDGSPYALDAADDSDSSLYRQVGGRARVRDLVELMITASSNLATNILIDGVGAARAQATARALGAGAIEVRRGVEDGKAYRAGLNNTTSARDLGALFTALAEARAASPRSCREMLGVLERQRFNEGIPAGVPAGARVAHKTGWITATHHDGGIVTLPGGRRFVLVVLTRGIPEERDSARLMADIARLVAGAVAAAGS